MTSLKARLYSLLRWSEKYTKTDMVFAFSTSYWSLIAQIMSSVGSLVLALVIARVVAKNDYGQYQYVISIISTLSIFSLSGLGNALLQSVARGYDQSLWDGFRLNLRWSLGVCFGAIILGGYYLFHDNISLGATIIIAGLASPLVSSFNLYGWFLNGKKDTKRSSIYPNGIGNIIPMTGILVAALFFHTATALVLGYVIGNLLTAMFLFYHTAKIYPLNDRHDEGLKRYSFHLSLANILNTIASNLDNLLLFHYLGAADVAIYNFAVSLPDQTKGPLGMLGNMMTARFSSQKVASIRHSMGNKMFLLLLINIVIIIIYLLIAPFVYRFLFPAYIISTDYSQIYAISLLAGIFTPASAFLTSHKCVKEQYANNIFFSIFQIAALFIGVITAGVLGIVLARTISRLVSGLFSYGLYSQASRKLVATN